jgi:hypothetical protein
MDQQRIPAWQTVAVKNSSAASAGRGTKSPWQPEHTVQHGQHRCPSDEGAERDEVLPTHGLLERFWLAKVHEEGLYVALVQHVALVPLRVPAIPVAVCLLERHQVEDVDPDAPPEDSQPEVGVIGNVERTQAPISWSWGSGSRSRRVGSTRWGKRALAGTARTVSRTRSVALWSIVRLRTNDG